MSNFFDALVNEIQQENREMGEALRNIVKWAADVEPSWLAEVRQAFYNAPPQMLYTIPHTARDIVCGLNKILQGGGTLCQFYMPSNPVTKFIIDWASWWLRSNSQVDTERENIKTNFRQMPGAEKRQTSTSQNFPGFRERKHICLIGSTDAGKTTNIITMLLKNNMFAFYDMFALCASGLDGENMVRFRKASLWNLNFRNNPNKTNNFAYFKNEEVQKCIDFISDSDKRDKQKLVFFDDQQAMSSRNIKTVGDFVMQAKNTNATLIISLHQGYSQGPEKKIRDACQYMIIFNQTEDTFNRLLGLKVGNSLWKKYSLISDKYKRVVIYDITERTLWYAFGDYERFDPVEPTI